MGDLISRKAVYEMLHVLGGSDATDEWADGWDKGISQAISDLDDIPVAYDMDKVVAEFDREQRLAEMTAETYLSTREYHKGRAKAFIDASRIVKGGGQG
jgi:hypothetical protein